MNPFDLRGPDFLVFYVVFAAAAIALVRFLRVRLEGSADHSDRIADPYAIARLRGGAAEAARTAAVSLTRRGLMVESSGSLVAVGDAHDRASDPLERAVLLRGSKSLANPSDIRAFEAALAPRVADLERRRLVPSADERSRRIWLAAALAGLLLGVAGAKVAIALGRGRTNVEFLLALATLSTGIGVAIVHGRLRTPLGNRTLEHLRSLLGGLRTRAKVYAKGLDPSELALLVAVYGLSGVPSEAHPVRQTLLFPSRPDSRWSTSGCGSSGGDGCGGGGGGGCGGCGGD